MAHLDFPSTPTIGQVYQGYTWDGEKWDGGGAATGPTGPSGIGSTGPTGITGSAGPTGGGGTVYMQDTPPVGAPDKSVWVETDSGLMFTRWNDGNSTQWVQSTAGNADPVMRGHLAGLTLSTAGSSATFGIAAGMAADSTNTANLRLNAAYTKTTAAWAVGSGNGALDTGAIGAASWYHVFLICRPDTGVVDVLVSLSPTAPTLPANYTLFRRIGSMLTAASNWVAFVQDGDKFSWVTRVANINGTASFGTARVSTVLSAPTGLRVEAFGVAGGNNTSGSTAGIVVTDLSTADADPSGAAGADIFVLTGTLNMTQWFVMTDTSARVGVRASVSSANLFLYLTTKGWRDRRGRDD